MARSQAEAFGRGRISFLRKDDSLETAEDHSSSEQEQDQDEDTVTDLSAHVQNSRESPEERQSFQLHSNQMSSLPNLNEHLHLNDVLNEGKDMDHDSHFHEDQPHIHHSTYHQDDDGQIHLRHGDHIYNSYHHSMSEQNNDQTDLRMNNQHSIQENSSSVTEHDQQIQRNIQDTHNLNSEISDKNNQCSVEDAHLNQLHQYSVSVSEGVLITIPHHRSSLIHHEPHNQSARDDDGHHQQTSNEGNGDILHLTHNSVSVQNEERMNDSHAQHHSLDEEMHLPHHQAIHRHSLSDCNDINIDPHMGNLHRSDSSAQDEEDNDNHSPNSSTITHLLQHRQLLQSHDDLQHELQVEQNPNHNQDQHASSLLQDKDISAHIIQHGRLSLDLSHNSSFPHIRSSASPRDFIPDRIGYPVSSLHSDFARTLSAINDSESNVDNLPLRNMLAPTAINYLTSNPSVIGQRDHLALDPGSLHAVSTPSITYHHLPEVADGAATPTSSPLYLPGVSSSSSKLLGISAYGRNHDANNVGSLMWSQVGEDIASKSSPLPVPTSSLLSRTSAGHVSSYVPDLSTWSGYDNVPQNVSLQLSQSGGSK